MLTVAALNDFEAWAVEAEGAFGHEQDTLLVIFAEAAAWSQAGAAVQFGWHGKFFKNPLRAGMRQEAASQDLHRQSRGRQAGPKGCRTWRARRRRRRLAPGACARARQPRQGQNWRPRELASSGQ